MPSLPAHPPHAEGAELTVGVNFLPKPFDVDSLLAAVRAALDAPAR